MATNKSNNYNTAKSNGRLKLKNYDGIEMNGKINKDTIYIRKSDLEKYFKIENKSEYIKLIKS